MPRTVELVSYNPEWPKIFQQEARLIADIFSNELVSIHHIGSTAIPNMLAKPIIDIMGVVREIERVELYNGSMIKLGYTPRGEYGIPERRYFIKATQGIRSHHVHMYPVGHRNISLHLDFRDYLQEHPKQAKAYIQFKKDLAQQYRQDPSAYSEAKTEFVESTNKLAARWRKKKKLGRI